MWNQNKFINNGKNYGIILPMSIQPLHQGHINMILNFSNFFGETHITVNQDFGTKNAPYSIEKRLEWLNRMKDYYQLTNFSASSRGNSKINNINRRRESYRQLISPELSVIIGSGNEIILMRAEEMGFDYLDINTFKLEKLIEDLPLELLLKKHSNGRVIRDAFYNGGNIPDGYIPSFISYQELIENI